MPGHSTVSGCRGPPDPHRAGVGIQTGPRSRTHPRIGRFRGVSHPEAQLDPPSRGYKPYSTVAWGLAWGPAGQEGSPRRGMAPGARALSPGATWSPAVLEDVPRPGGSQQSLGSRPAGLSMAVLLAPGMGCGAAGPQGSGSIQAPSTACSAGGRRNPFLTSAQSLQNQRGRCVFEN